MSKECEMVSICVFAYNHERYIEESINSILAQKTGYKIEVLIFDDCSQDNTVGVIKDKFGDRVKIYQNGTNKGYCATLYKALTIIQGDYFFSLAGDDRLSHDFVVDRLIGFLIAHSEYTSVTGWNKIINKEGEIVGEHINKNSVFSLKDWLTGNTPCCYEGFIRVFWKDKIRECDILLRGARNNEEIPFWTWVLSHGDKAILQEYMMDYRFVQEENGTNYNSITTSVKGFRDNYQNIKLLEKETQIYFGPMIIMRTYNEIVYATLALDIKRILGTLISLTLYDFIMCIVYIPILYFRGKRLPRWMENKVERCIANAYRKNTF